MYKSQMYLYEYVYIYISYSIRDRLIPRLHRIVLRSCYTYTLPPSHPWPSPWLPWYCHGADEQQQGASLGRLRAHELTVCDAHQQGQT